MVFSSDCVYINNILICWYSHKAIA